MTDDELTKLRVEAWKTIVTVQQHFNDIEMTIRGLAITVLAAVVAAAALAVENGKGHLGVAILVLGVIAWLMFLFVDQAWYHRLLLGSVKQGIAVEKMLPDGFGLTTAIGDASPIKLERNGKPIKLPWVAPKGELHSTGKILVFYGGVAIVLLVAAVVTWFLVPDTTSASGSGRPAVSSPTPSPTPHK